MTREFTGYEQKQEQRGFGKSFDYTRNPGSDKRHDKSRGYSGKGKSFQSKGSSFNQEEIVLNSFKKSIYDEMEHTLLVLKNYDPVGRNAEMERIRSTQALLRSCIYPLSRGINRNTVRQAVTPFVIMSIVNPEVKKGLTMAVCDVLEPFAKEISSYDSRFSRFYEMCRQNGSVSLNRNVERLPYNPQQAAIADIALNMRYYDDIRKEGITTEERNAISKQFRANKEKLYRIFKEDGIRRDELEYENNKIVVGLCSNPSMRKYFDNIYDGYRVDFSKVEYFTGSTIDENGKPSTTTIFSIPTDGLKCMNGESFRKSFGVRPIYGEEAYRALLYESLTKGYPDYARFKTENDESALKSEGWLKCQQNIKMYMNLAKDDGMSKLRFQELYNETLMKCESEYAVAHEKSSDKEAEEETGPGRINIQSDAVRVANFQESMTNADIDDYVKIIQKFAGSVTDVHVPYAEENLKYQLKYNSNAFMQSFLDVYSHVDLNESQLREFDLIKCVYLSDMPAIDDSGHIIATRHIEGVCNIGDIGGEVDDNSYIGPGCFVDKNSKVVHSRLKGNVVVGLGSDITDSAIDGTGMIINSSIVNCNLNGCFDPFKMRSELGMKPAPLYTIRLNDKNRSFGKNLDAEKMQSFIANRFGEYNGFTREEYIDAYKERKARKVQEESQTIDKTVQAGNDLDLGDAEFMEMDF